MIQRLIAEVEDIQRLREFNDGGVNICEVKLKVRIIDSILKTKLPRGTKGKTGIIVRKCIHHVPKLGDHIVLTEDETRKFIKADVATRRVLQNRFVRVEILEPLGARIGSLAYKPRGMDIFTPRLDLQKAGWLYYGGILDTLSFDDVTSLWNKGYKYTAKGYEYKKGKLKLLKHISTPRALPAVYMDYSITVGYKRKLDFGHHIMLPRHGLGQHNIVFMPLGDRVEHLRYQRPLAPWTRLYDYSGLKAGGFIHVDEQRGICLLCCAAADKIEVVRINLHQQGLTVTLMFKRNELTPTTVAKYRVLYLVGESFYVDRYAVAIIARNLVDKKFISIVRSGKTPLYLYLSVHGRDIKLKLSQKTLPGIGTLYVAEHKPMLMPTAVQIKGITYA